MNQQFRRDIFIKGPRRLTPLDRAEALRAESFVLLVRPEDIPMTTSGSLGEVKLQEGIYRPLIEILARKAYAPKTLGEIADDPSLQGIGFEELVAAVLLLANGGHAHPAQAVTKAMRERCKALNLHLCHRARSSTEIVNLASPVAGAGVPVERFQQLFLLALQNERKTAADQAAFAWDVLSAQGQRLVKGGATMQSAEENVAELTQHATQFAANRLPLLKALGIA